MCEIQRTSATRVHHALGRYSVEPTGPCLRRRAAATSMTSSAPVSSASAAIVVPRGSSETVTAPTTQQPAREGAGQAGDGDALNWPGFAMSDAVEFSERSQEVMEDLFWMCALERAPVCPASLRQRQAVAVACGSPLTQPPPRRPPQSDFQLDIGQRAVGGSR